MLTIDAYLETKLSLKYTEKTIILIDKADNSSSFFSLDPTPPPPIV